MVNIWETISPFFFKGDIYTKKTMKHLFNDIPEDEKNNQFNQVIGKAMQDAVKTFENSVTTILSQAGR